MAKRIKIPDVNEKLLDKYIRHSVYMEQLKNSEAAAISKFLNKETFPQLLDKLINELNKVKNIVTVGSIRKIKRIRQIMAAVETISTAGVIKAGKRINKSLFNISKFEVEWNKKNIEQTVPLDIDFTMPSNTVLRELVTKSTMEGHKMSTLLKSYSKSVQVGILKELRSGVAIGESIPALKKRIVRVLGKKSKQAEALARTAVSNIVHKARETTFKENKELIRKVQIVATLDDRTTLICINLDGKLFNVGEGDRPPFHFQCRTTTVPVITSWQEFGVDDPPPATRASMNGAVPAKTTYKQWLKRQPKVTQIKVLGKKRADLYRSGRVKIDRFVGRDLKPLNLKQLARREGLVLKQEVSEVIPKRIETIPIKGVGKLTSVDKEAINFFSSVNGFNIVRYQLKRPLLQELSLINETKIIQAVKKTENALNKLDGWKGVSYRGLNFEGKIGKKAFFEKLKVGEIWKSKSFQSTSKKESIALQFTKKKTEGIIFEIKGYSGRDISKFTAFKWEEEVLFKAGTPFKVTKIKGNKIWLEEITEQAQLKAVVKGKFPIKAVHEEFSIGMQNRLTKLQKQFPNAAKKLKSVKLDSIGTYKKIADESQSLAMVDKGSIHLNGRYYAANSKIDTNKGILRMNKRHWMVSKNSDDIITHEFGHIVESNLSDKYIRALQRFQYEAPEGNIEIINLIRKQISDYASENWREMFAEAFTQWQMGEASPIAKRILKAAGVLK